MPIVEPVPVLQYMKYTNNNFLVLTKRKFMFVGNGNVNPKKF